jgi:hypothetical protein
MGESTFALLEWQKHMWATWAMLSHQPKHKVQDFFQVHKTSYSSVSPKIGTML